MEQLLELARERKLDRVGATYAVVAWILVQAASIALPAFDAPLWALRWLIVAAMAGFPLVLALTWMKGSRTAPAPVLRSSAPGRQRNPGRGPAGTGRRSSRSGSRTSGRRRVSRGGAGSAGLAAWSIGTLRIASAPGAGTRVELDLPLES